MSDVWKGAAELKSYLRAAIVMPTCKENHIQASCTLFQKLKLTNRNINMRYTISFIKADKF